MKNFSHKKINKGWFTLIELAVVITVLAILWSFTFDFYANYKEEQLVDDEISDIQQYWLLLSTIINKTWDIPLNYCKNVSGWHDSDCFEADPLNDWSTDNICSWVEWDFFADNDCDSWCVIIDCETNICSWNNIYYDFEKLFSDYVNYNYTIRTDSFTDKFSYRICPEKDISDTLIIWKWDESSYWTFSPSFTLYYGWRTVYRFNSNP